MSNPLTTWYRRWQESRRERDKARAEGREGPWQAPNRSFSDIDPTGTKIPKP